MLEIELDNEENTVFSIPFHVPEKIVKGKVFAVNKEVQIESQKMTIQKITIHPLRVEVQVTFNESNTMQLLNFEDMRIEDDRGNVWSKIQNGISGVGFGENEQSYYLQSNYFEQPSNLYFKFNKIQALPKEEMYLIIDTDKQKVLKQPTTGGINITKINRQGIEGYLPAGKEEFKYFLFYTVEDAKEEVVEANGQSRRSIDNKEYFSLELTGHNHVNPLRIQLGAYPNYIHGEVEVELKE